MPRSVANALAERRVNWTRCCRRGGGASPNVARAGEPGGASALRLLGFRVTRTLACVLGNWRRVWDRHVTRCECFPFPTASGPVPADASAQHRAPGRRGPTTAATRAPHAAREGRHSEGLFQNVKKKNSEINRILTTYNHQTKKKERNLGSTINPWKEKQMKRMTKKKKSCESKYIIAENAKALKTMA